VFGTYTANMKFNVFIFNVYKRFHRAMLAQSAVMRQ